MLKHLYPKFVDNKDSIDINKKAFALRLNKNRITFLDVDEDMKHKFSSKQRDSYEAPATLMFADLFSEAAFVDPRNIQNIDISYKEVIDNSDADIVMFMYNSSGFDSMIAKMIDKGIK